MKRLLTILVLALVAALSGGIAITGSSGAAAGDGGAALWYNSPGLMNRT